KDARDYIDSAINGRENVYEAVSENNFFRTDISDDCDNYPMLWGLPSMRAFQSVVSTSIMEFYDNIGVQRDVASRPDLTHYTLRGLCSVKYFYREVTDGCAIDKISGKTQDISDKTGKNGINASKVDIREYLPGFKLVESGKNFEVYENELYIPMGFGYDTYISEDTAKGFLKGTREKMLIKALVLSDEQIEKYGDILTEMSPALPHNFSRTSYERACHEKQRNCSKSFSYDSHGFTADIELKKPELVFFSVPYSEGWTASVNGKPADVEKVSYGFMAVKADAGDNKIEFRYETPGFRTGACISLGAGGVLIVYLLIMRLFDKKRRFKRFTHSYDYSSLEKVSASEIYTRSFIKKDQ
ncbi:YfhO family protein, partial [Ruminococcus sp.]|uniref:YfhO family protein n=1 Tax=Ruminococcus sp. TaxID=41978 RepID=UPI0025E15CC7